MVLNEKGGGIWPGGVEGGEAVFNNWEKRIHETLK